MIFTYEKEIQRIAERVYDNKTDINQKNKQRRNSVVDMYGVPFEAQGDKDAPATIYLSVSPDLIQYLRFQLKVQIKPFISTVSGGTSPTTVTISGTSLSTENASDTPHNHTIVPNPHDHESTPHSHNVVSGITLVNTTSTDFRLLIDDIDITAYLMEQHGGEFIDGEGIFPTSTLGSKKDFYDILEVAGLMDLAGEDYKKLIRQGFKKIQVSADSPFGMTVYVYLKYNYASR